MENIKNKINKVKISISISTSIDFYITELCNTHNMNKSKLINSLLLDYIKKNLSGDTTCPNCHRENALIYSEGCVKCKYCEMSLC